MYSLPIEYFRETSLDSIHTHSNRVSFHHESKALPLNLQHARHVKVLKHHYTKVRWYFETLCLLKFIVLGLIFWVSSFEARQSSPYYN